MSGGLAFAPEPWGSGWLPRTGLPKVFPVVVHLENNGIGDGEQRTMLLVA